MKFLGLVFAVALAGGCADSQQPDFDLGGRRDLSISGGDDLSVSGDDLATGADLASSGDGAMVGCTKVTSWPGLTPFAGYDSTVPVTFVDSFKVSSFPSDVLEVGDYHAGAVYPKMVTFSATDTFGTCDVCAQVFANCDNTGACDANFYFAQAGSVTVTRADSNETIGRMTVTGSNLKLVEWSYDGMGVDQPVAGGKCYQIDSLNLNVPWDNTTDGGAAPGADMKLACTPVVNELQTAGTAAMIDGGTTASYEFVEIYNPCPTTVDLTGWKLVYRSAANNKGAPTDTAAFSFGTMSIPAAGYLLIAGSSYLGTRDGTLTTGLAALGGAVGLRDSVGTLVDSVSYNTLSVANNFTEGAPAANPPAGSSLERFPNGADSNHNNLDFKTTTTATPRAANL